MGVSLRKSRRCAEACFLLTGQRPGRTGEHLIPPSARVASQSGTSRQHMSARMSIRTAFQPRSRVLMRFAQPFGLYKTMPFAPPKPCVHPGSPNLTTNTYCEQHQGHRKIQREQFDSRRGSAASRGYGRLWQAVRLRILARDPVCVNPFNLENHLVVSTDVDHRIPRSRGGDESDENLRGVCHSCHSRKTATEDSGFAGGEGG